MASETTKFYNMIVHLIRNNKLYEENVAVKNVWQKGDNVFFDLYFYGSRRSYVFDAAFIHDLLDLNTEKYYKTPQAFFEDFARQRPAPPDSPNQALKLDNRLLQPLREDLVLMAYLALRDGPPSAIKLRIIYDYVCRRLPNARSLTEQYLSSFVITLEPSEQDFYAAIEGLAVKKPEEAAELLRELLKICLADGRLGYTEKICLAEILQALRLQGLEPDIGL